MLIHLPPSLIIDDRFLVGAIALLGALIFIAILGRRIWRAVKRATSHQANNWARAIWSIGTPIILALFLGMASALIWPKLGIPKDSFLTRIGGLQIQVDGAAGVFTFVYLGALGFLAKRLPREARTPPTPPPITVRATPDSNWPDLLPTNDST
jgi:polyferredoxin